MGCYSRVSGVYSIFYEIDIILRGGVPDETLKNGKEND